MQTNLLTKDYFARRKGYVLTGLGSGLLLPALALLWRTPPNFIYLWLLILPFLTSPYMLGTRIGRLWWTAYACFWAAFVVVRLAGPHNPLAWVATLVCGVSAPIALCLRWSPPAEPEAKAA